MGELAACQLANRELSDPLPAHFREISEQYAQAAAAEETTHTSDALIQNDLQ